MCARRGGREGEWGGERVGREERGWEGKGREERGWGGGERKERWYVVSVCVVLSPECSMFLLCILVLVLSHSLFLSFILFFFFLCNY